MGDVCLRRMWTGVFVAAAFSFSARLGKGEEILECGNLGILPCLTHASMQRVNGINKPIESSRLDQSNHKGPPPISKENLTMYR